MRCTTSWVLIDELVGSERWRRRCRPEAAAMTSDVEVERLERLQKLRSRFRKPRRGSDLP